MYCVGLDNITDMTFRKQEMTGHPGISCFFAVCMIILLKKEGGERNLCFFG